VCWGGDSDGVVVLRHGFILFLHVSYLVTPTLCAGDATSDVRLLDAHHLVLATPQQWDMLSRRWKQRKAVQGVGLFIADELQLLGGQQGPTLEVRGAAGGGPGQMSIKAR